jgi:Zn-dependent protease with chaperone function
MRDFFQHQEHALSRSARLVALMAFALGGTVLLTAAGIGYFTALLALLRPDITTPATAFCWAAGLSVPVIAALVATSSVLKIHELGAGGSVIADRLGADLIQSGTQDINHRKILNVVEEIAIAAGIPVPAVYVMEGELGINALAAGYSPLEAVIVVTRGCIDRLTRDQLQGVIAHEFSHIINGDMPLNVRAIGVLHGILVIPLLAESLITYGWKLISEPAKDGKDHTIEGALAMLLGAILWLIGSTGLFLSLIIKTAINRQREYLADASAVEYTRNPEGIGGALKVIAGYAPGARVRSSFAMEASHLFFADGVRSWGNLLRTHPPITERIVRIEPNWDGVPLYEEEHHVAAYEGAFAATLNMIGAPTATSTGESTARKASASQPTVLDAKDVEQAFGCAADTASDAVSLPAPLRSLTKHKNGARVGFLASWAVEFAQVDNLSSWRAIDSSLHQAVHAIAQILLSLDDTTRIAFLDRMLDAVSDISNSELQHLTTNITELENTCPADDIHKWSWYRLVDDTLSKRLQPERGNPRFGNIEQIREELQFVLSAMVYAGGAIEAMGEYTFHRACAQLSLRSELKFLDLSKATLDQLDRHLREAFDTCSLLSPAPKRSLLLACGTCITGDRHVSPAEALMIRLICAKLNYPRSRVLPGQPVTPGA